MSPSWIIARICLKNRKIVKKIWVCTSMFNLDINMSKKSYKKTPNALGDNTSMVINVCLLPHIRELL